MPETKATDDQIGAAKRNLPMRADYLAPLSEFPWDALATMSEADFVSWLGRNQAMTGADLNDIHDAVAAIATLNASVGLTATSQDAQARKLNPRTLCLKLLFTLEEWERKNFEFFPGFRASHHDADRESRRMEVLRAAAHARLQTAHLRDVMLANLQAIYEIESKMQWRAMKSATGSIGIVEGGGGYNG